MRRPGHGRDGERAPRGLRAARVPPPGLLRRAAPHRHGADDLAALHGGVDGGGARAVPGGHGAGGGDGVGVLGRRAQPSRGRGPHGGEAPVAGARGRGPCWSGSGTPTSMCATATARSGGRNHAPYDAIVVAAGGPKVPVALRDQLGPGGRLVMPVGPVPGRQVLVRERRGVSGRPGREELGSVRFVPLVVEEGLA